MVRKNLSDINKMTFEQSLTELEGIVSSLESGEVGLDEAIEIYVRGQKLREHCSEKLAHAKLQVEQINVESSGKVNLTPFDMQKK